MIPVVILTAGSGTRLGEIGKLYPKALLPVGDCPLLELHLRVFIALGAKLFVIVTDPSSGEVESAARRALEGSGAELAVVHQAERRGIGHAALLAGPWVKGGPFALVLGDTYYSRPDLAGAVRAISGGGPDAVLSVRKVADEAAILKECTIELDAADTVLRIVEKPARALSLVKPCGVYFFGPRFMAALGRTRPSALRGEIELTDAIQGLIAGGGTVKAMETLKLDVNITYPEDILTANAAWLEDKGLSGFAHPEAAVGAGVELEGSVVARGGSAGAGARLVRTVVFPGGRVPAGASVSNSLVLPGFTVPAGAGS
ncbi:MAG: sugar phosphate nucleotidyltransferase [Elusimicrobia bacterium]|nr:sugar phosphate nucleotidyltransferase [Elusimicrobiota bacterium]